MPGRPEIEAAKIFISEFVGPAVLAGIPIAVSCGVLGALTIEAGERIKARKEKNEAERLGVEKPKDLTKR